MKNTTTTEHLYLVFREGYGRNLHEVCLGKSGETLYEGPDFKKACAVYRRYKAARIYRFGVARWVEMDVAP